MQTLFTILTKFVIKVQVHGAMKILCTVLHLIQKTLIYKHQGKEADRVKDLQKLTKMVMSQ